jgi:hypothetical protein
MARVKCPHERGKDYFESEAVDEVGGHGFGEGRKDHLEGGSGEDRCVLPAGQANQEKGQGKRGSGSDSWEYRSISAKPITDKLESGKG